MSTGLLTLRPGITLDVRQDHADMIVVPETCMKARDAYAGLYVHRANRMHVGNATFIASVADR